MTEARNRIKRWLCSDLDEDLRRIRNIVLEADDPGALDLEGSDAQALHEAALRGGEAPSSAAMEARSGPRRRRFARMCDAQELRMFRAHALPPYRARALG